MNYAVPTIIEFGASVEVIQGTCGWGGENGFLDKTGYFEQTFKKCNSLTGNCRWSDECAKSAIKDKCSSDNDC